MLSSFDTLLIRRKVWNHVQGRHGACVLQRDRLGEPFSRRFLRPEAARKEQNPRLFERAAQTEVEAGEDR